MRVIARDRLVSFWEKHPATRPSLQHWFNVIRSGQWHNANEVRAAFSKAKVLNGERVRFEVAGGDYRLIAAFDFRRGIAFVKFIGTHAEYDRIDALSVTLFQESESGDQTDQDRRGSYGGPARDRSAVGSGGRHRGG